MSSEWRLTTLGDICAAQGGAIQTGPFGSQLHTSDYKTHGIPVVMPTNIGDGGIVEDGIARIDQSDVDRLPQHKLQLGDIVFSRRGDVTKNALIRQNQIGWFCGTGCLKVRLGNESVATTKFISHCLRQPGIKDWLVRHAVGATMPNLNTGILSAVPILLPPLNTQQGVAALLDAFDERITLLRETNATLEAIAQALFKSWFVDFDPVRAKMEGRAPEGMDEATAALFPDSFEESELGLVPKGWRVANFGCVCAVTIGGLWGKDSKEEADLVPAVSLRGVDLENLRSIGFAADAPVRWVKPAAMEKRRVSGNEVLIASSGAGPCGRPLWGGANFESLYGMPVIFSNFVKRLDCGTPSMAIYVDRLLAEMRASREIWNYVNGTSIPNLDDKLLLATKKLVIPSSDVLSAFGEIARVIYRRLYSQQAQTLASLRDTLLPRLISGQLRLPEAEATLQAAL